MGPPQRFRGWRATREPAGRPSGLPAAVPGTPAFPVGVAVFGRRRGVSPVRPQVGFVDPSRSEGSAAVDVDRGRFVYPSPGRRRDRKCTFTVSPQSVGGLRAGEIGGGSRGSPRCVRIFRIGPGSRTECPPQPEVANSAKARDGFVLVKQSERNQSDLTATPKGTRVETPRQPGPSISPR